MTFLGQQAPQDRPLQPRHVPLANDRAQAVAAARRNHVGFLAGVLGDNEVLPVDPHALIAVRTGEVDLAPVASVEVGRDRAGPFLTRRRLVQLLGADRFPAVHPGADLSDRRAAPADVGQEVRRFRDPDEAEAFRLKVVHGPGREDRQRAARIVLLRRRGRPAVPRFLRHHALVQVRRLVDDRLQLLRVERRRLGTGRHRQPHRSRSDTDRPGDMHHADVRLARLGRAANRDPLAGIVVPKPLQGLQAVLVAVKGQRAGTGGVRLGGNDHAGGRPLPRAHFRRRRDRLGEREQQRGANGADVGRGDHLASRRWPERWRSRRTQ
jgi:hypothetical protein